jgi:NAD(P)-dependent dehydrogenase (short-subunit alcohol dehydrogenase family)
MDFTGKKVFTTGGSRGIGRACAIGFAERGDRVAGRSPPDLYVCRTGYYD